MTKNIKGIEITPLQIISDHRGSVMHMLRNDSKIFQQFGEIYFSTIFKDKIKAWHLHKEATLNYACVFGSVKLNSQELNIAKKISANFRLDIIS